MSRVGWIDATGGISGDMLLGACLDAGASLSAVNDALAALALPEQVHVSIAGAQRSGLAASRAEVHVGESTHHRALGDILGMLAVLDEPVRGRCAAVFETLAAAEAEVHGVAVEQVHFHEVGALDSIADVVGVVTALHSLTLDRLACSPVSLGAGTAATEHGRIPVPVPAVLELLRAAGAPGRGGPVEFELATPTGVALAVTLADAFEAMPAMQPTSVGTGAGRRDPDGHANVTRLVIGHDASIADTDADYKADAVVVIEANVDDMDPRLWPAVLADLLAAGALDAWLVPILMKKGRPAHTLTVLAPPDLTETLELEMLTRTTSIGVRKHAVDRRTLLREWATVDVGGHPVRIKTARLDGRIVNAVPEFTDVARVAGQLQTTQKAVLAAAVAAADAVLR